MYGLEESGLNCQRALTQKYDDLRKPLVKCVSCGILEEEKIQLRLFLFPYTTFIAIPVF